MKYGTASWILKQGDRKSISFYVPEVKDLIDDSLYIGDSIFEGVCVRYFFEKPSDLVIDEKTMKGLSVDYMTKESAIEYLRTNTNMKELSEWRFLVRPEREFMGVVYPEEILEIN